MSAENPYILIVDDERENLTALERALKDANPSWKFSLAESDAKGIAIMKEQLAKGDPIDIVLTDLVMDTEQGGMNMIQEARNIDPFVMPILFTAKERNLDRYKAFECGAFDVVEKNIRGASSAREINLKTRAALQYRAWSQKINFLRRYFDPGLFARIEKDPAALDLKERTVTICFWDIRGFSKLCEILKAHPTLIAGFLREYCEIGAQTIFENHGLLDKFIGDGIMALFGVLNGKGDDGTSDAIEAVKAAIALRPRFDQLLRKWTDQWQRYTAQKIEIGLGCGIHTGEALVGNVGTQFRDQFTALGPHVNLAARIESKSKAGQILLSQTTAIRVKKEIKLTEAGEIGDIKNIAGDFKLYEVP